jgi:hypothetical protein
MAGASPPGSAASRKSKRLWTTLSARQQKTVQKLQTALSSGSQIRLADWHVLGELAHALSTGGQAAYGRRTVDTLAELLGCAPSVVLKARKFARFYSAPEAATLESKVSWSEMHRLIAIDDASTRMKLLGECSSNSWTLRQLEREIRSQVGRQRRFGHGGRSTRRPQSQRELLSDLDRLLTSILHWYHPLRAVASRDGATHSQNRPSRTSSGESFGIDQLSPPLRHRIADAMGYLEELRHAVQGAIEVRVGETPTRLGRGRR